MKNELLSVLEETVRIADDAGQALMLVGAWARDIALDLDRNRAKTRDVDFALRADDWDMVQDFFAAASSRFEVRESDLTMRHRRLGVKVDIVPWGGVAESERLRIPNSDRELNLIGLREAYALSKRTEVGEVKVAVPSPAGMLVLKLLAFADRLAPRDLNDVGELVRRFPVAEDPWADELTREALMEGSLTLDKLPAWSAGRRVRACFCAGTCNEVTKALALIRSRPAADRARLMHRRMPGGGLVDADGLLEMLALGMAASPSGSA